MKLLLNTSLESVHVVQSEFVPSSLNHTPPNITTIQSWNLHSTEAHLDQPNEIRIQVPQTTPLPHKHIHTEQIQEKDKCFAC